MNFDPPDEMTVLYKRLCGWESWHNPPMIVRCWVFCPSLKVFGDGYSLYPHRNRESSG